MTTTPPGVPAPSRLPSLARAVLRFPLFYKILVANSAIVVLGAVVGTTAARQMERPGTVGLPAPLVVALLAASGVLVSVLVNALILRVALAPLERLEAAAARVGTGDLEARVPESVLADQEMQRLTRTFNSMLDGLESYRQRLREVAARALRAEEEERLRISRELHDDTAQTLAALLIRLRVIKGAPVGESREAAIEELRSQLGDALERVRRFARGLRPPALEELGLLPALEAHVRGLAESLAPPVRVEADTLEGALAPDAELALYRIAQEALSNAVRHSGAPRVELRIRRELYRVELTVSDDGLGFDVDAVRRGEARGLGLFGMRERAAYVGGTLEVRSSPGHGTVVRASVPVLGAPEALPGA